MAKDINSLRKALIKKAKRQVQVKYSEKDVHIARAVSLLSDLDNAFNLLAENCIEWYSTHFPEMHSLVKDNEAYLAVVKEFGGRKSIRAKGLEKLLGESSKAAALEEKASSSMGSDIPEKALEEIRELASNALRLRQERRALEKFVEKEMKGYAGNFSELAGPVLGARLLAAASGLKQLALMPASTVQLLGAEKALFRHLRNKKSKGPKYGLIYGHPLVKKVPGKHKGKVARSLAGKLVIAARADYFGSKSSLAEKMLKELEERAARLQ
jgi:nucleolar protein 56